jgi:hypothetical protein
MEENKDAQEYAEILKAEADKFQNKEYEDWDSIVLHLAQGDKSIVKIKMMRQDIDAMQSLHGQSRSELLELMIQTIEDEAKNKK